MTEPGARVDRSSRSTEQVGVALLNDPTINKGTAFTEAERSAFGLHGLLPPRIETIEDQLARIRAKYDVLHDDLERHIFLRSLQDTNEVLYYAFLERHLTELLPIVYTPTVGQACQEFSQIYRRPHGLFLAYPDRHRLDELLGSVDRDVSVVVITDGQRILGLGDQGVGGMGIPIGKLSLYSAVGGIAPADTLPILVDVGTDNPDLLADPLYLGWRNERIVGQDYDDFIEQIVTALQHRFPGVLVQWEDFASDNAAPLLERYRDRMLSFNDDIQGTAAVALAAVLAGLGAGDLAIGDRPILIVGAGSAGTGIAGMLSTVGSGANQIYLTDANGLLTDDRSDLEDYQRPFATPRPPSVPADADLATIVGGLQPAVLIGVSGQPGLFTREIVTTMASAVDQPVIMPLSNPTSRAEATPSDILAWTGGRALVATGSPFEPVLVDGEPFQISQANNVYVFPGLGLGVLVAGATRVTDAMLAAAAAAVADDSPCATEPASGLLPDLGDIHATSRRIAVAVALAAAADDVAPPLTRDQAEQRVLDRWWEPRYPSVEPSNRAERG